MATAQKLKLGPRDHGQPISYEDFQASETVEGYHYEIIDGKVYVSPLPNPPHMRLDKWLDQKLDHYCVLRPDVINLVYNKTRVFVPGRKRVTYPEPDVAAYQDYPLSAPFKAVRWRDVSPVLVAEVLSPDCLDKDLVRNVELYLQVLSIQEYWVVEGLEDPETRSLRVYRRRGKRWQIIDVACGETYTTKLLPGFKLIVDPRK
jgi:Uma2 family endonuclease